MFFDIFDISRVCSAKIWNYIIHYIGPTLTLLPKYTLECSRQELKRTQHETMTAPSIRFREKNLAPIKEKYNAIIHRDLYKWPTFIILLMAFNITIE